MAKCAWCQKEGKLRMGQKWACDDHKGLLIDEYAEHVEKHRKKKKGEEKHD